MNYRFPDSIFAQHTAVLGKTGSGKTSTTKLMVEQLVPGGSRVCVLDPIKSDWWGLTSSADGTRPGLPFYILGGPRGHAPLHSGAGAAIGELVGRGDLPLSIVDMSGFRPGGHTEFFIDFAEALFRSMKGVLFLVMEEAHLFAPKERSGYGEENMSVHWASRLATAARSRGVRLLASTQRTQKLHNDILGSCDTVVAHRLTAPADQKPVIDWLKGNSDKATADKVAASLASLKTGEGWLCSGEAQIFDRVKFPMITTYDNSRTPTEDDGDHQVRTAAVDQDKLLAMIGAAVKEAEDHDPKRLAAEVKELKKKLADALRTPLPVAADTDLVATLNERLCDTQAELARVREDYQDLVRLTCGELDAIEPSLRRIRYGLSVMERRQAGDGRMPVGDRPTPAIVAGAAAVQEARASIALDRSPEGQTVCLGPEDGAAGPRRHAGGVTGPQQKILDAMAWWESVGVKSPTSAQVAVVAGYSPGTGTLNTYFGSAVTAGLITRASGIVTLTDAGRRKANRPQRHATLQELHARVLEILDGPGQRLIQAVIDRRGQTTPADEIARAADYSPGTGTINTYFGNLTRLGLITRERGQVRATAVLFPEGLR